MLGAWGGAGREAKAFYFSVYAPDTPVHTLAWNVVMSHACPSRGRKNLAGSGLELGGICEEDDLTWFLALADDVGGPC